MEERLRLQAEAEALRSTVGEGIAVNQRLHSALEEAREQASRDSDREREESRRGDEGDRGSTEEALSERIQVLEELVARQQHEKEQLELRGRHEVGTLTEYAATIVSRAFSTFSAYTNNNFPYSRCHSPSLPLFRPSAS
jgi:predicted RNase H-like nuclease (RuvC/YqgF family)